MCGRREKGGLLLRVFVADDHPAVRQGLRAFLGAEPEVEIVGEAAHGERALAAIRALRPDVAVLDLRMPGLTGIEVARRLRQEQLPTAVVMLSMHAEQADIDSALAAGALGYVVKEDASASLMRAIRAAARGEVYLSPTRAGARPAGGPAPTEAELARRLTLPP